MHSTNIMFTTKLEVDRHVEKCVRKINSESERNLRCFSFAKLYFGVGEYDQARRYISSYLSVKPNSAEAHQLLGKSLECLGRKEAALESYRTSLQLDPKQNNLVIKVCELLAEDNVSLDQSGARYFCEMAQSFDPHNPAVYILKEKLITAENDDPHEVSALLLKELESRPTDVNLRVRLLYHLLQHNMVKEAYKHAADIETKNMPIFLKNLTWYEVVAEVLIRYQRSIALNSSLDWEFWFMSVAVLDKLVCLSLDEDYENIKNSSEYVVNVFNFDQTLTKASQNIDDCPDKQLLQEFLNHYGAQLCFHLATLMFKQAKKDLIKYKDASNITLPLFFIAYHISPPDLQSMWLNHVNDSRKQLIQRWHKEASYRCSQVGHILLAAAKDRKSIIIEKTTQYSTGLWKEQLFKKMFITRDQQLKIPTSYFLTWSQFNEITIRLPEIDEIHKFDEQAQLVYPDSLHHHVWICLNNSLVDYKLTVFDGLQYSVKTLKNCGAETLSILDIEAFIYCTTLCAQSNLEDMKSLAYYNNFDKPNVLPAAITQPLGTLNQCKFLTAAYKMFKNEYGSNMGELRLVLIKGIEVVRCVDYHGLDVKLLIILANTFADRAKKITKQSEIEFNEARAELYWKTALPLLTKLKNNQAISYSRNRLFTYKSKEMSFTEICSYMEKGNLFIGAQLMKKKEHEKALRTFELLKDPYASFYQAQIYKYMADQQVNQNKENVTSEMRSQHIILLSRARDCLYLTLDRLREPSVDPKHPLNSQLGSEIEKIERLLSRIDPDCTNRNECDGMSDENVSSAGSAGDHYVTSYAPPNNSFINGAFTTRIDHNNQSTPFRFDISRREARPSPERLDAQLRQLSASKDATISHILDQNKIMIESHRNLIDELRCFKDAVTNLTSTVDDLKSIKSGFQELKDIKKSVDELKASVDELENFKNVSDLVYEMKKEIADLKKDVSKTNQLSDEDIYGLATDYSADFNINSNMAAYNTNLYSNYQGRMPGGNSIYGPPPLYPGIYPPMAYAYGGLSLPPAGGALQFGADQQLSQDLRNISVALSQVQPTITYGQAGLGQVHLPQTVMPPTTLSASLFAGQGLSQTGTISNTGATGIGIAIGHPTIFKDPKSSITQAVFTTSSPSSGTPILSLTTNKAPPNNVVITSSDPLPLTKVPHTSQPILSVTIPPQHLKGNIQKTQPHNYQIPLPTAGVSNTAPTPSILSKPPPTVSTQSLLSNIAPPVYSAINDKNSPVSKNLGLQIEKKLDQTFNSSKNDNNSINISNYSSNSIEEHDPCPDFKPIIPLPDEVPITTGEENEIVLFAEKARLYRFQETWRERGVGVLKILKNPQTGKVRILMRRDQVHKICANHFLTKDMNLVLHINSDRAYIWAAHDFADESVVLEKFCVRFKDSVEAKRFYEAFENAKKDLPDSDSLNPNESTTTIKPKINVLKDPQLRTSICTPTTPSGASLGGFVFSTTPTFKPKQEIANTTPNIQDTPKTSPFASFIFASKQTAPNQLFKPELKISEKDTTSKVQLTTSKTLHATTEDESQQEDDFIPSAEFKPVIPLPAIVDVVTGEENCDVLFENKAKLLRFDSSKKEWKERGVGIMKILKDNTVRLVMRRDQVHKVCCNHLLLKNIEFKFMPNNTTVLTWCAQDFSDGILKLETFAIKFKNAELANNFLKVINNAQSTLDENNCVVNKHIDKHLKSEPSPTKQGLGDKLKPVKGSWGCKNCFMQNDAKSNYCTACETPKNGTVSKKNDDSTSGAAFSFGVSNLNSNFEADQKNGISNSWNNAFKPKEGSWECKCCYIRNDSDKTHCVSCEIPKDDTVPKRTLEKGINLDTGGLKFSFGIPSNQQKSDVVTSTTGFSAPLIQTTTIQKTEKPMGVASSEKVDIKPTITNWGDKFKPKAGSWECSVCYIRNNSEQLYCVSCENPKDSTVPKKDASKGINLDTPGLKFTFGMPTSSTTVDQNATPKTSQFTFGSSQIENPSNSGFTFKPNVSVVTTEKIDSPNKFVFGSPQKHDFEFTPKSPRRISTGQKDDESDNSYVEEECDNIYFKPVIPLPDKIDVKTGEEDEDVLYCHRAKLYRFSEGQWKERGIGDLKILRRKDIGKLRVVMRRDQIFKICLNHALTPDIEYKLKDDDKTWLFYAADFSEGEISHDQFCLRFKNAEIAQEFKQAVSDALLSDTCINKGKMNESNVSEDDDDDVIVISETKVTPEQEKEALKLGLPLKFFAYRQLPDCSCQQCKKDDEYFKDHLECVKQITSTDSNIKSNDTSSNSITASLKTTSTPVSLSNASNFGTTTSFTFTPPATAKNETLKELLTKPSILSENKLESSSLFQSPLVISNSSQKSEIFSTPTSSSFTTSGNRFGSKPSLFGTPETGTNTSFSFSPRTESNIFNINPTSSVFGSTIKSDTATTPSIFGSINTIPATTAPSSNIFDNGNKISSGSIFDSPTTGIFRNTSLSSVFNTTTTNSIFGYSTTNTAPIFGTSTNTTSITGTTPFFNTPPSTTGSIFHGITEIATTKTSNVLPSTTTTGNIFSTMTTQSGGSIFGGPPSHGSEGNKSIFGGSNIFGQSKDTTGTPIFGATQITNSKSDNLSSNLKDDDDAVLDCNSGLTFASLAANVSSEAPPAFAKTENVSHTTPFAFLGAGAPVFGGKKDASKTDENKTSIGENEEEFTGNDDGYDPHYEPIVPLPDTIVVSTGEEDETALFSERAKLYRFDIETKEWKERGVGQMKILYHPTNNTYRFLLRREQVHKVVLNQLIIPDLDLQPMKTSDQAWVWAGYNYTDDEESALEKLAIRFKNCELAKQFYAIVQDVIGKVKEIQSAKLIPSTVQNLDVENVCGDDQHEEIVNDEDEDEDADEDEDERSIMFTKRCTLSEKVNGQWETITMGDLQVYYDPEIYAARISVTDDTGLIVSNTLIGMNTVMEIDKNNTTWKGVEWSYGENRWRKLRATFSSEAAAQEFFTNYLEGVNYAQEFDLVDEIPVEHDEEGEETDS